MKDNPGQQKTTPKRRLARSRGTIEDLSRVLWHAITEARGVLGNENPILKLKAVHAIATAAGSYLRSVEIGDLEARIAALETGKPITLESSEVAQNGETLN